MRVLAIETSCDETAAAVVEGVGSRELGVGTTSVRVLSSVVASQADLHARTAGVVPEVAARAHVETITFVIDDALRKGVGSREQGVWSLDAIAVTTEPGLRPALVVGEAAARALAVAWEKPLIPVNHLAGHLAAAWLTSEAGSRRPDARTGLPVQIPVEHRYPIVALVVSGGHTQLWKIQVRASAIIHDSTRTGGMSVSEGSPLGSTLGSPFQLTLLGQTRDDAAGEAFDKIARLLGLPYPGGAAVAQLAEAGEAGKCSFPRPMIDSPNDDFSFSGLKTAVFYFVRGKKLSEQERADIASSAQEAIVDVLVSKTVHAAARQGAREVILTGGVAANVRLRQKLSEALGSLPLIVPHPEFCTDNAAMIGAAAVLGLNIPDRT